MFNPFENLQTEMQNQLQGAIDKLGPAFWTKSSLADEHTNSVLHWHGFGFGSEGYYHVSIYDQNRDTLQWSCTGATVVEASVLNFAPTREKEAVTA